MYTGFDYCPLLWSSECLLHLGPPQLAGRVPRVLCWTATSVSSLRGWSRLSQSGMWHQRDEQAATPGWLNGGPDWPRGMFCCCFCLFVFTMHFLFFLTNYKYIINKYYSKILCTGLLYYISSFYFLGQQWWNWPQRVHFGSWYWCSENRPLLGYW